MRVWDDSTGALIAARDFPTYVDDVCGWDKMVGVQSNFTTTCNWGVETVAVLKINLSEPKLVSRFTVVVDGALIPSEGAEIKHIIVY